jgi:hypothetical protein
MIGHPALCLSSLGSSHKELASRRLEDSLLLELSLVLRYYWQLEAERREHQNVNALSRRKFSMSGQL